MNGPVEGDYFIGALVETFREEGISRPRVRALMPRIPCEWKVEFPRNLREDHPIGSRFRADLKVCQKHNKDGSSKGQPYLRADTKTISLVANYTPDFSIKAVPRQGANDPRIYDYIGTEVIGDTLEVLRDEALASEDIPIAKVVAAIARDRSNRIKRYIHFRANGVCECCGNDAPFISVSGKPYLEVHHIVALSDGGEDSIVNTAAVCPNCHAEVTSGMNAAKINSELLIKVRSLESRQVEK